MATWPDDLPGPQAGWQMTAGSNALSRKAQSGRIEVTRYGSGAADHGTCTFKFIGAQKDLFESFYRIGLNLGVNWFSASWLTGMGYPDHKAKVAGYVPVTGAPPGRYEYAVTLYIKKTSACPADTAWPE